MNTKPELLAACKTLGITGVDKNTKNEILRAKIQEKLGNPDLGANDKTEKDERTDSYASTIAKAGAGAVASKTGPVTGSADNIPNLSPNGDWEGKRARIRRVKTGHNDMSGAIFNWNGWPAIIPIDVECDVAWPIFEIIKKCEGMEMEITQEDDPKDKGKVRNVKTITHYAKYPFQFIGITPGTENLPESPWEYTLDAFVEDFPNYTVRMWRQLCILWELPDSQCNIKPGISPDDEVEVRKNAVHYALNLPIEADKAMRIRIRDEKRADIGMEAKAA